MSSASSPRCEKFLICNCFCSLPTAYCLLIYGYSSRHAEAVAHHGGGATRALAEKRRRQGSDGRATRRSRYRQSHDGDASALEWRAAQDPDRRRRERSAWSTHRNYWRTRRRYFGVAEKCRRGETRES